METIVVNSSTPVVEVIQRCAVCNETHTRKCFGVVTCNSCVAFFLRVVRQKRVYNCDLGWRCDTEGLKRSFCKACRFQKCISVGMNTTAVQKSRDKIGPRIKQPVHSSNRTLDTEIEELSPNRTSTAEGQLVPFSDSIALEDLLTMPKRILFNAPEPQICSEYFEATIFDATGFCNNLMQKQIGSCNISERATIPWERLPENLQLSGQWVSQQIKPALDDLCNINDFRTLSAADQVSLLRAFMPQSVFLEYLWFSKDTGDKLVLLDQVHYCPQICKNCPNVLSLFQSINPDETEYALLRMIAFWNPEICSNSARHLVDQKRFQHILALEKLLHSRNKIGFGRQGLFLMFAAALEQYIAHFRKYARSFQLDELSQDLFLDEDLFSKGKHA